MRSRNKPSGQNVFVYCPKIWMAWVLCFRFKIRTPLTGKNPYWSSGWRVSNSRALVRSSCECVQPSVWIESAFCVPAQFKHNSRSVFYLRKENTTAQFEKLHDLNEATGKQIPMTQEPLCTCNKTFLSRFCMKCFLWYSLLKVETLSCWSKEALLATRFWCIFDRHETV